MEHFLVHDNLINERLFFLLFSVAFEIRLVLVEEPRARTFPKEFRSSINSKPHVDFICSPPGRY